MTELFNHHIEPNSNSKAQFSAYNDNVSLLKIYIVLNF